MCTSSIALEVMLHMTWYKNTQLIENVRYQVSLCSVVLALCGEVRFTTAHIVPESHTSRHKLLFEIIDHSL